MSNEITKKYTGPIAWMAQNHVAANLMMLIILIGGFITLSRLKQEIFPEFEIDLVVITCPYPGASPSEVESGILLTLEEKMRSVDGVKAINATAKEGVGVVSLELLTGANRDKVLNDVKNVVDRITSFPEDMETPSVALADRKIPVITVVVSGDEDHATLHSISEVVRAELLNRPEISQVVVGGVKPLEISIDIKKETLEEYNLSLTQIAQQIRLFSLELPGGSVETKGGTFLVRLSDRKLKGEEFENVIIKTGQMGGEVRLGDIAKIRDGYSDVDLEYKFNGKPAVTITAYRIGKETPTEVAASVRQYLAENQNRFPESVQLSMWDDNSVLLKQRIELLVRNATTGLILVIIVLALFLQKRLALWVAVGIPVSFFGTFFLMGPLDASINMITLFALIITLGMVVDDAIIIAENVYHKMKKGIPPLQAAIEGAQEMTVPVTFSILTTIAAFFPLLVIPGVMGKIFYLIPVIVISVLFFSWMESFFILPAHLGHNAEQKENWLTKRLAWLDRLQERCNSWLKEFIEEKYQPFLRMVLKHRYLAIAFAVASLFLVIGTLPAGILKFNFFPATEGEIVSADLRLTYGIPMDRTEEVAKLLLSTCNKTLEELNAVESTRGIFSRIGQTGSSFGPGGASLSSGSHLISILVDLGPSDERDFSIREFSTLWKKNLPVIPGTESFKIGGGDGPRAGKDIDIELYHRDIKMLGEASIWLADKFREYEALTDVENSFTGGKPQMDFKLRPGAYNLGITSRDVGVTIRNSFYGAEALREQRGRNEMKVVVRLPKDQRKSEYDIENMLIPTRSGTYVPLASVASMTRGTAPTEINRLDGERVVNVSAEMKPGTISGNEMLASLKGQRKGPVSKRLEEKGRIKSEKSLFVEMQEKFPGIKWGLGGQQKAQKESFASLGPNFLMALLVIFTLLAIPFKSYFQPIIVMTAIPFGIVGAFTGHLLLGYDLSIISAMGIIALSGVVVNDSLVLVDATNKYRLQGLTVTESLIRAGMRRFRPIMLTSLTTFFGLLPMIFETSRQARFLIPMAISLGFGILFATVIVLLIVPALYIWLERIRFRLGYIAESEI